jgi:hypothetical protein
MREFTILTSPQTDAKDPCLRANLRKLIALQQDDYIPNSLNNGYF